MGTTNKFVLGVGSMAAVAILALGGGSAAVFADTDSSGQGSLVERIATKFNLDESEVQAEFKAHGQERQEARLDEAVADGTITEDQKTLLMEKRAEMAESRPDFSDMNEEEAMAAREEHRTEMKAWAEENGIDLEALRPEGGQKHRAGMGGFGGNGRM